MMLRIQTFCLTLPHLLSQLAYSQYYNGYPDKDFPDYENEPIWQPDYKRTFDYYNEYVDDIGDCRCFCATCVDLRPCCKNVCLNCLPPQQSMLIVPYVYPVIITNNDKKEIAITTQPQDKATLPTVITEVTTTTKAEEPVTKIALADVTDSCKKKNAEEIGEPTLTILSKETPQFVDKNDKYETISLQRRKTNWLPKYGIVPIPDKLAEKILLQLRNMKLLHPTHNNIRATDFMNKYKIS